MRAPLLAVFLLSGVPALAADKLPTLTELKSRGEETLARLARSNAMWTIADLDKSGTGFRADVTHTPDGDRYDFSFVRPNSKALQVGALITRKNVWYANFGQAQLTRPYELVFPHPALGWLLSRVTPSPVKIAGDGVVLESDDKSITFATALPPDKKKALEKLRLELLQLPSSDGGHDKQAQQLEKLDRLLKFGVPIKIDRSTGLVLESGTSDRRLIADEVTFISDDLSKVLVELPADTRPPPAPTQEELNRSVLFGYAPGWKPGLPESDLDLVLVDPKAKTVKRVPIQSGLASSGAFVAGRKKVVATVVQSNGTIVPIEIDLVTGANRPLAEDNLKSAISIFPVASPDGSKVVVQAAFDGATSVLESQLWLIDLKTGASSKLGEPADQGFVSWLPGSAGVVVLTRQRDASSASERHLITRLSLKGERTELLEGDHPLVLADSKTILFQDVQTHEWNTCDLGGKNKKPFGNGFKGYGMPTASPDGKSVLMNRYVDGGPRPTVIKLADFSETPFTDLPGLWAYPTWR